MNEVVHTSPTIGSNVEEVIWKNIHFIMWDIGGQETLRSAWNTYFANTQVWVFFVSNFLSLFIFHFLPCTMHIFHNYLIIFFR